MDDHFVLRAGNNDREDEMEMLRHQLESTFQQLEEAKRRNAQDASRSALPLPPPISLRSASYDTHARLPTPVSHLSKPPTPNHPTADATQHALSSHHLHLESPAQSPYGASSASSVRSNLTVASAASSPQDHHQQHSAYLGDLQYISSLGPIPEEGSVRTATTAARSAISAHNAQSVHQEVHSFSESKHSESHTQSHTNAQGSVHRATGIAATAAHDGGASVHSEYSANADATPVHTLLRGAYAEEQSERALDETIHKQLQSLTATNAALSARATQLEQRLRHSELRCKLLMDQIKSMPVSLSVAQVRMMQNLLNLFGARPFLSRFYIALFQAEKRVTECKLEKATTTYEINLKKLTDSTVSLRT
jgi:hypothetical protein